MPTIKQYVEFAQLAQASYALFNVAVDDKTALQSEEGNFTNTETNGFLGLDDAGNQIPAKGFTRLHHTPNDPFGFSATLFKGNESGEITLAIRGTEPNADDASGTVDLFEANIDISDRGLARNQLISLYNYYQRLTHAGEVTQWRVIVTEIFPGVTSTTYVKTTEPTGLGIIPSGTPINLTGHSMGGHLALALSRLFPNDFNSIYTYNAPGFKDTPLVNDFFNMLVPGANTFPAGKITNVFAEPNAEIIAGLHGLYTNPAKFGQTVSLFIEDQGLAVPGNHSIVLTSDAWRSTISLPRLIPQLQSRKSPSFSKPHLTWSMTP
jgi:hypothetical protein